MIDADAVIEDIKTKLWDWDTIDGIKSSTVLKQTITDIGNAPTIDAVPVVRCKDCFLYGECKAAEWYGENGNGYCSVGDRRKDDERLHQERG